jgi:hypothetical protein
MPNVEAKRQTDVGLRLAVSRDSNVARSNATLAAARGLVPEDYTLRPQATFTIVQPIGRQAVFLKGAAGYDFYQENSQLNRQRIDVSGGGVGSVGMCKLALTGVYSAGQSQLDDLAGVVTENLQEQTSQSVTALCGRDRGFNAAVSGLRQDVSNSAARQQSADHKVEGGTFAVGYGNPSIGKIAAMYAYSAQDYANRPNANGGVGDGYQSQTIGANYEKTLGRKLKIVGAVGNTRVKRDSAPPGVPLEFTSMTYNGVLSYAASRRLDLTVAVGRGVTPSNRAGKLYDISTTTDLLATYRFGTRFVVSGGGRLANVRSNADTALAGLVVTDSEDRSLFASIRYQQSKRASLVLDLRQEERTTNLPLFDYSNTRFGLTLDVSI